eukprot:3773492-Prymnesium_polylepis.1
METGRAGGGGPAFVTGRARVGWRGLVPSTTAGAHSGLRAGSEIRTLSFELLPAVREIPGVLSLFTVETTGFDGMAQQ